ncbi:RNA polymerase sigma factor [Deminuibacter soli]|uniref:RNA polymerase sigma-70 factor n=1 Tax=Deminuibacter soli TaxID=2291815 RepID=A0A3E1NDE4_9BACT|nr:sigma-70 family RNA polymerase sigma factor [Deminuibacter soli]RFM26003.1 hypothetical protein DXN05_21990 [Deminuibacter soli]
MHPVREHEETDLLLWLQVRNGNDKNAFEQLYRRYMQVLYAAIYKFTEDAATAEDILQEVFLDIWEKRASIVIENRIFPYLYSMARFKIFDYLRKKQLNARQLETWQQLTNEQVTVPEVFENALRAERETMAAAEIAALPEQLHKVYILSVVQQKGIAEIAAVLQVSPNTVKNHLQKLRRRFRNAAVKITSLLFSLHLLCYVPVLNSLHQRCQSYSVQASRLA